MFPSLKTVTPVEEESKSSTGRRRCEAVFLKRRQEEQGYNLTEPTDLVVTGALTGR